MNTIKKVSHWILFFIGGSLGTIFLLYISVVTPVGISIWIWDWNDFLFTFVGGILLTAYYFLIFSGFYWYYSYLNKVKPDYWISNILLAGIALYFFVHFFLRFTDLIQEYKKIFFGFKGLMFFTAIIPAYFKILFASLIGPFIKEDIN